MKEKGKTYCGICKKMVRTYEVSYLNSFEKTTVTTCQECGSRIATNYAIIQKIDKKEKKM